MIILMRSFSLSLSLLALSALSAPVAEASRNIGPCSFMATEYGGKISLKGGTMGTAEIKGQGPYSCTTRGAATSDELSYSCEYRGGTITLKWKKAEPGRVSVKNGVLTGVCERAQGQ